MIEALPDSTLQQSLNNIAKSLPNFVSRPTQRQMIEAVFNVLSRTQSIQSDEELESDIPASSHKAATGESILIIEGPTGTGKSLGYLLPAIVAAKLYAKRLVVSSATVMLQEQLANKDIPFIAKHAGIPITYSIAKGRGRYLCPNKLFQQTTNNAQTDFLGTDEVVSGEKKLNTKEIDILKKLAHQFTAQSWMGDRDTLNENVPDILWSRVTNDRHGCLKRECTYFKNCPFYEARDRLEKVDIIVVNHDLLLADLAMGGGIILPAPENTFYCIDEAHHLPDKAIQQFAASHAIFGTLGWLEKLHTNVGKAASLLADYTVSQKAQYAIETIRENLQTLGHALEDLFRRNAGAPIYRCQHGVLPQGFDLFCGQLLPAIRTLLQTLRSLQDTLKRQKTKQEGKAHEALFDRAIVDLGFFTGRVENLQAVWELFAADATPNDPPIAKWMTAESFHGQIEYHLHASPVRASQLLAERLWQHAAGVVLTSATLRSLGSFEKLLAETGLNHYPNTTCIALPSPFNLSKQGKLSVPAMKTDPKNPDAHTREVIQMMPRLIALDKNEGTLALFSSKKQMLEVAESLPLSHKNVLLIQGNQSKEILLKTHFNRIENDQPSVLFGLASFAEGLDLPGKACTHVIIAKLPFSMPDDPVSQTLAEWITLRGGNPFFEVTLPEASIRLIQAMGRLIRAETDTGMITILDTRLTSKPYGRLLKQTLPPFRTL
jgi:ATP-dependent DNA helicase DinG